MASWHFNSNSKFKSFRIVESNRVETWRRNWTENPDAGILWFIQDGLIETWAASENVVVLTRASHRDVSLSRGRCDPATSPLRFRQKCKRIRKKEIIWLLKAFSVSTISISKSAAVSGLPCFRFAIAAPPKSTRDKNIVPRLLPTTIQIGISISNQSTLTIQSEHFFKKIEKPTKLHFDTKMAAPDEAICLMSAAMLKVYLHNPKRICLLLAIFAANVHCGHKSRLPTDPTGTQLKWNEANCKRTLR